MSVIKKKGRVIKKKGRDEKQKEIWDEHHDKIIKYFGDIGSSEVTVTDIKRDYEKQYGESIARDTIYRHLEKLKNGPKDGKVTTQVTQRGFLYSRKSEMEKELLKDVLDMLRRDSWVLYQSENGAVKRFYFPKKKEFDIYDYELWRAIKNQFLQASDKLEEKILICFLVDGKKLKREKD